MIADATHQSLAFASAESRAPVINLDEHHAALLTENPGSSISPDTSTCRAGQSKRGMKDRIREII